MFYAQEDIQVNIKKNKIIDLKNFKDKKNIFIFQAGTKILNNDLVSSGGRVLNIVAKGANFLKIRKLIIQNLKKINWRNGFFRKDIGWRVIKKK